MAKVLYKKLVVMFLVLALLFVGLLGCTLQEQIDPFSFLRSSTSTDRNNQTSQGGQEFIIYCAATVKAPVTELLEQYREKQNQTNDPDQIKVDHTELTGDQGNEIQIIYGNSGELLSQLQSSPGGGVYIPGDPQFLDKLAQMSVNSQYDTTDKYTMAEHYPVLVTNDELGDQLKSLTDLKQLDPEDDNAPSFLLVKPDLSALSDSSERLIENADLTSHVEENLRGRVGTANQVPMYLSLGIGDIGITWSSNYLRFQDELSLIEYPNELIRTVPITGMAVAEEGDDQALERKQAFLEFLVSDEASQVFERHGY
ncbi:molybdate ABC transporter substrate-binding protein [Natranaerobius thermophilus]|uniref:molybdate ABC transporter substrate-binding protein n=1 Tax=Natranaerobius thermophilus TaxID=375929 RepID=UPI000A079844